MSTAEQSANGGGLRAQRDAIERESERRGWELLDVIEDAGFSARDLKRPGIQQALATLERGDADGLLVSKLDRLSRSMLDFTNLMSLARNQGWALIALDCAVDTTTPAGGGCPDLRGTSAIPG